MNAGLQNTSQPSFLRKSEHFEKVQFLAAVPQHIFDYADDQARLGSHMNRSSWMMAGSKMEIRLDENLGRSIGSHIRLFGTILGIPLSVEEVVQERNPPWRKSWRTINTPRLLVIDSYEMGFDLSPQNNGSLFRVYIDFVPSRTNALVRWLQQVIARFYALHAVEA